MGVCLMNCAMANPPREEFDDAIGRINKATEHGELPAAVADDLLELADAMHPDTVSRRLDEPVEVGTAAKYLDVLRVGVRRGLDLEGGDVDAINCWMERQHDDRGLSKQTCNIYQSAVKAFHRYHDTDVDPDSIVLFTAEAAPRHDETDMFTQAEVDALREACTNPRDRALLELLVYTGQRITALLTLRVGDVDVEAGVFYLNTDADGLKGADRRGRKRPLFGARKYVRDWLEYHPEPRHDNWLFVPRRSNTNASQTGHLHYQTVRGNLLRIAERAGVDKPVNPHNFRHYFVTVMKRDYNLDADTLRALLGVARDSDILERTYSHVTTDDYIDQAEAALGYRESEDGGSFTPDACPTCGELLESHWRRCPACGEAFAPTDRQLEAEVDEATTGTIEALTRSRDELTDEEIAGVRAILDRFSRVTEAGHAD